jgi:hypothetical protein
MTENSTLFYIYDNTNDEESSELQGKLLDMQAKEILNFKEIQYYNAPEHISQKVLETLK